MKEIQKQFLNILKLLVNNHPAELSSDIDIKELLKLGEIHNLSPALGYALNGFIEKNSSDKLLSDLSDSFLQTVIYQYNRLESFEKLLDILNRNKIKVILIKGVVVNRYYPARELRTFGDIDFLITPEDRERLDALMISLGYERTVAEKTVWAYSKGAEKYEVHIALLPNEEVLSEEMKKFISEVFVKNVPTEREYIFEPEPSYHFVFLLLHIAKHMKSYGAGVRMYLDLALMLKNEKELDFDYIKKTCALLQIDEFLNYILVLCDKWFGVKCETDLKTIDEETFSVMEEYVLSAGIFGFYERNPAVARIRNTEKGVSGFLALKTYIFPSYGDIKEAYTWLNGRPYLLPVAWLVRVYDGLFLRRKRATNILKGMFTEKNQAEITDAMLKNIGLKMRLK